MLKIMFVCHGNICRSPMAEFVFRDMVKRCGKEKEYVVSSCATSTEEIWGGVGNPVYPPAREELLKHGISCAGKRAVQLQKSDYEKYDLFLCMDEKNMRGAMRILGADPENKVRKFLSFTAEPRDVADPWYSGDFKRTYEDIYKGCEAILAASANQKER